MILFLIKNYNRQYMQKICLQKCSKSQSSFYFYDTWKRDNGNHCFDYIVMNNFQDVWKIFTSIYFLVNIYKNLNHVWRLCPMRLWLQYNRDVHLQRRKVRCVLIKNVVGYLWPQSPIYRQHYVIRPALAIITVFKLICNTFYKCKHCSKYDSFRI